MITAHPITSRERKRPDFRIQDPVAFGDPVDFVIRALTLAAGGGANKGANFFGWLAFALLILNCNEPISGACFGLVVIEILLALGLRDMAEHKLSAIGWKPFFQQQVDIVDEVPTVIACTWARCRQRICELFTSPYRLFVIGAVLIVLAATV